MIGDRRFLKKELDMKDERRKNLQVPLPRPLNPKQGLGSGDHSLDFLVNGRFVAVGAELLEFHPFGGVPAVLFCGVARHTWRPFGGVGPAFSALESDHDPDALVLSHEGRCAA